MMNESTLLQQLQSRNQQVCRASFNHPDDTKPILLRVVRYQQL
jgi:hypothetical protein